MNAPQAHKTRGRRGLLASSDIRHGEQSTHAGATLRRGEDELHRRLEAEARYRALVERLPFVTYNAALDVQAAFTFISPQVETLLGYKPEDFISDRTLWLKRMLPEDRQRILPTLGSAHHSGEEFSAEYRLRDRTNHVKWILDESDVIRDKAGRPLFIQGMWTDITQRKKKEQEMEGMGRELSSSQSELEQFVSIASHELKAPLRRIVNLGEILALRGRDPFDATGKGLLAQIRDSAATAQELIAGLVAYGETEQRVPLSTVDLNLTAQHVRSELSEQIHATGAVITCGTLPRVLGVPALLERVLYNLLDNAIKFHDKEPPRIHISAARSEGQWIISVRDNGIGIHQRQALRIFSIFEHLHTRREYPGVGLGLAICKKIVERFGGRIWVESEPGEGSTFHFSVRSSSKEDAI